jgi:hypothetical protein
MKEQRGNSSRQGSVKEDLNRSTGRVSHGAAENTERSILEISVPLRLRSGPADDWP